MIWTDYNRGCRVIKLLVFFLRQKRLWQRLPPFKVFGRATMGLTDWETGREGGRVEKCCKYFASKFHICIFINILKTLLRRISYQVCQYKFHGFSFFLDFEAIINPSFLKTKNCRKCWFLADKDNWFPLLRSPDLATLGRGWRPLWLCNKKKSRPAAKSHKRELGLQERTLGCRHGNFQGL